MVPPSTFCKFSKIVFVISSYAFFELFKIFGFFNLFRNVEKFRNKLGLSWAKLSFGWGRDATIAEVRKICGKIRLKLVY